MTLIKAIQAVDEYLLFLYNNLKTQKSSDRDWDKAKFMVAHEAQTNLEMLQE